MGIIYLISIGILLISFIAFKKTSKQINIISFISISVVTLFCYQAFLCYLFTFVGIPITLEILTMVNLLIAVSFIVLIIRKKEYQKYSIDKLDVLSVSIIAIVVLVVSYLNFGFPFDVNYETGDPSVHYLTAVMFAKSDALLAVEKEPDAVYSNFNTRKTVSYVNSGLLMKSLCPELEPMDCYHVFVSFGILTLFLTGMSLYAAMRNLAKKKEHILYALIIALIALLGYPLNSLLFGFEYLSMGLLIICTIIDFIYYYEENLLKLPPFVIVMSLLNFGLFSSYYMFVPFVYPALWIYFCLMQYRRTKKIITKPLLLLLIVTLLIPFILGYIYHIEPQFYGIFNKEITNLSHFDQQASHLLNEGLSTKGYIYINLYSNMLLLIPLVLYLLVKDIKEHQLKRDSFILLLLGFLLIFLGILFVGHQFGKVSTYYLSKNYFALWLAMRKH